MIKEQPERPYEFMSRQLLGKSFTNWWLQGSTSRSQSPSPKRQVQNQRWIGLPKRAGMPVFGATMATIGHYDR